MLEARFHWADELASYRVLDALRRKAPASDESGDAHRLSPEATRASQAALAAFSDLSDDLQDGVGHVVRFVNAAIEESALRARQ